MSKTMLIDAVHQEETRVALVNKGRVEDFDFETTGSEQLRGNIYLAKVTRVEPSLQACFVEYGGNRHGFLAFSEIHPDYYQLPQADREALLEEAAREAEAAADEDPDEDDVDDEIDAESDQDDGDDDSDEASTDADNDDEEAESADAGADAGEDKDDESSDDTEKKAEAKPARRRRSPRKSRGSSITRRYKIQEVIRRRQVLLVQVVKEERGNKGAALTTYLSLAGRYSVLMPNTPRGGGISRKIPSGNDRKRLKTIMDDLQVPKGMGLIVRTAGAKRTKSEIRRDYDYLQKLWAIDVNSGKSTKERNIEQTALHTNLEAAEEACRQMRLRDLAGLVVIDFIDMDENKNNRAVEKKMKEALKLDRARVQNNRISQFGLMEISRQRRRAGVLQATSAKCESCDGTGRRRSTSSAALQLLRAVEARAAGGGLRGITVTAPTDVALYLLNSKRDQISAIEEEAGFTIAIKSSGAMIPGDFELDADKASSNRRRRKKFNRDEFLEGDADDHLLPDAEEDEDEDEVEAVSSEEDGEETGDRNKKRRRRGRRGGRRRRKDGEALDPGAPPTDGGALLDGLAMSISNLLGDEPDELPEASEGGLDAKPVAMPEAARAGGNESEAKETSTQEAASDEEPREGKKRRRRRRRKRRGEDGENNTEATETTAEATEADATEPNDTPTEAEPIKALDPEPAPAAEPEPEAAAETDKAPEPETTAEPAPKSEPEPEPAVAAAPATRETTEPVLETTAKPKKKKRGWWSR